jgi:hypothetical protein
LAEECIDHLLKVIKRLSPDDTPAIQYKSGCALDAQLPGKISLVLHELSIFSSVYAVIECRAVQPHICSEFFQVVLAKGALVFTVLVRKQVVVVLPITILVISTFGCFSSPL